MEIVDQLSEKHQKLTKVESGIGCLPDLILCQILSYLPTKHCVKTSVLARRWRFLWTHVSNIKFDMYNDFVPDSDDRISSSEIINRVLLLNNAQCLKSFSLWYAEGFNENQFDSWIRTVIARHIQAINICFVDRFRLPDCLFNSKTLVDLTLENCFCRVPRAACLPSLKKLRFEDVEYENDETLPNLISGCLVLEVLKIYIDEDVGILRWCSISSPSLIHLDLRITRQWEMDPKISDLERKLVLDTPSLQYLTIEDGLFQHISARSLCSVVKADVDLKKYRIKEDISCSHAVFAFVERLYNVQCLKLSSHHVMTFLDSPLLSPTSRFDYLTKLDWKADWRLLTKLLHCADKLEVLTIREVDFKLKCWRVPEHIPTSLLSSLRTLFFYGFGGRDEEFDMLRYILRHAKLLKFMKICSYITDFNSKFRALQQISLLSRGSDTCEIDFC